MISSRGFTLIEIIVAVALVAILSAAIAPSVLNNIAQGRVARAQSDVQAIAQGIMKFKSEVGVFPRLVFGTSPDSTGAAFDYLGSGGANANFPTRESDAKWAAGASFTQEVSTTGSIEDVTSHLIFGVSRSTSADSLYPRVSAGKEDDPTVVGFRSGVISSDPLDPWGNSYMVNVAPLGRPGQPVWVISAGPNGLLQTTVSDTGYFAADNLEGDDIGFRIQ